MKFDSPSLSRVERYVESDEAVATVTGGVAGATLGGLAMHVLAVDAIRTLGKAVGAGSLTGGWFVLLPLGVLLAIPFSVFVSGSINGFVNQVIVLSSRYSALQKVLVPLLNRSALAVTTASLGAIYGLAVGVVLYLLLVPAWFVFVGDSVAASSLVVSGLVGVLGMFLYGNVLGVTYGLFMEA